ncbi:acetyl-CoA synthetase-like protein [Coniophora puteana RWD-64-598 SS2]|uniref:Acetyl-CoA synthetase-like protein n=1 Tax=Coniophora puteana (strain RWD-64-598) TaxID=741705 RepID=A0A5M3N2U1_CONPW|nr:acetyl-CoA synthetase-like protein [Coniophora puteana RWD-64-598 SS2]EIW85344.1 acetyl-CoA synthetase-like protein [Coniophora puteana RWD-64-598 SS2]
MRIIKSLYPPLPPVPEQNVHHVLLSRPDQAQWPDFTFQVDAYTGLKRSFSEFKGRVIDGATALASPVSQGGLGLSPENGDLVGLLSENCLDYITLAHSCLATTIPFCMFSSYGTPYEFQHTFKLGGPTLLFVSPKMLSLALSSGIPKEKIYVLEGSVAGYTSFQNLLDRTSKLPRVAVKQAKKDTLAYLVFSSGTSGLPKAVMISHGNLIDSLMQVFIYAAEGAKVAPMPEWKSKTGLQTILNPLPFHHTFGLHMSSFRVFFLPVTVIVISKWNIDTYFDAITKYKATTLYLVPSLVHQIVHHPRFEKTDFSTVSLVHSGAAYLPAALAEQLRSRISGAPRVSEGYGMSETTISVSNKPQPGALNGRAKNVLGSAGILLPGVEVRVIREDGSDADVNEPGELLVRSKCVALGYWRNEEATKATFRGDWLYTGDRFRIDEDGVLFFEDRTKDILKVSGMQVSPVEIENTLMAHPSHLLKDAAVAGVSGGRTSDEKIPRAWVVLDAPGRKLGAAKVVETLDAFIKENLSKYKWLRGGIEVVDEIPKNPTGKVLRRVLVEKFEQQNKMPKPKL